MAQFKSISKLQIGNHAWYFTDPQIIENLRDENSVGFNATLRISHEVDYCACEGVMAWSVDERGNCDYCGLARQPSKD